MIELSNVKKVYKNSSMETPALKGVNLSIKQGEFVAIVGRSGSGKTTLLNIIGGMDFMTAGSYLFENLQVEKMSNRELENFRRKNISFIFQNFELMDNYSVFENVEMPLIARNVSKKERAQLVSDILIKLDINDLRDKYPNQISGGQCQRVAIARALVTNSKIILADEPTGSLDEENSQLLMELLKKINSFGKTIILITHDKKIADQCDRTVVLYDGVVKS